MARRSCIDGYEPNAAGTNCIKVCAPGQERSPSTGRCKKRPVQREPPTRPEEASPEAEVKKKKASNAQTIRYLMEILEEHETELEALRNAMRTLTEVSTREPVEREFGIGFRDRV